MSDIDNGESKRGLQPDDVFQMIGVCADLLAILGFAGLKATKDLRIGVTGGLALLALALALTTIVRMIQFRLNPFSSFYSTRRIYRGILVGGATLVIGIILAIATVNIVGGTNGKHHSHHGTTVGQRLSARPERLALDD